MFFLLDPGLALRDVLTYRFIPGAHLCEALFHLTRLLVVPRIDPGQFVGRRRAVLRRIDRALCLGCLIVNASAAVKTAVAEAVKPIEEKVAALSAAAEAHEKADLIAEAAREGKVIALGADAVGKITVEDLKATIAKTPVTVPLNAKTPTTMKEKAAEGEVPEELRQIALNCGVSPDIFKAGK